MYQAKEMCQYNQFNLEIFPFLIAPDPKTILHPETALKYGGDFLLSYKANPKSTYLRGKTLGLIQLIKPTAPVGNHSANEWSVDVFNGDYVDPTSFLYGDTATSISIGDKYKGKKQATRAKESCSLIDTPRELSKLSEGKIVGELKVLFANYVLVNSESIYNKGMLWGYTINEDNYKFKMEIIKPKDIDSETYKDVEYAMKKFSNLSNIKNLFNSNYD